MEQAGSGCSCQVTGPKAQAELREEHRWSTGTFVPGRLEVCSAQLRSRRAAVRCGGSEHTAGAPLRRRRSRGIGRYGTVGRL